MSDTERPSIKADVLSAYVKDLIDSIKLGKIEEDRDMRKRFEQRIADMRRKHPRL